MGAATMHPFNDDEPPTGFPTFGSYAKDMSPDEPGLKDALVTPTYRQVNVYLDYLLELNCRWPR